MSTYAEMSIEELIAEYRQQCDEDSDASVVEMLLNCRVAARDAILDLAQELDEAGWVCVPREATEEMVAATADAMKSVNNCIQISALHGVSLVWHGDKPPIEYAYSAMIAASPPPTREA